ncbi:MAG: sensor histidine kinase [Polyangiaceae bacterium]
MSRRWFEPIVVEPTLSTPLLPTATFRVAFIAALLGAVAISSIIAIQAMSELTRALFVATDLGMIALALAFRSRKRWAVAAYLAIQVAAGSFLAIVSRSDAELALLGVLAQAVLCAPRQLTIPLAAWGFVASTLGSLRHGLPLSRAAALSLTSLVGSAFVIAFVELAISAWEAKAEAARLVEELGLANQRLRELSIHLETLAAERERNRIARDVHDILGHSLTAAHAQLTGALAVFSRDTERAERMVGTSRDLISEGLEGVRASVSALRGGLSRPLLDELHRLFSTLGEEGPTYCIRDHGDTSCEPKPEVAMALYRATQECLTNALRHAHATHVELTLERSTQGIRLVFEDNGVGPETIIPGSGLRGLEERIAEIGGTVRTSRASSGGFLVEIQAPLTQRALDLGR